MTESTNVRAVTIEEFESLIQDNAIVIVDFWAQWCAPCRQFARVYAKIAEQFTNVVFAKLNIEEEKELAEAFQIRSIPHVMVFKQGVMVYSQAGSLLESGLKDLVQQALDLDVSAVKAALEEKMKADGGE